MANQQRRCAVYTRKSTEAGLEQDFNSLHAQREACIAYINSQKHEGWSYIPEEYDDGGYSGGSMDRPALNKLLADVAVGKIDIVVVYKVDRLTRSLMDFSKIVEALDKRGTSFVSITQHFNTTTSMGRLTLNVLLSFAQFEREVTSERIRDKIAASKKKGMWMGGFAPMGYDIVDQKLVVNESEAKIVQYVFQLYLKVASVRELKDQLYREGIITKSWTTTLGREIEGTVFSRGRLYHLLKNCLYIGKISHKGELYKGHHDSIISEDQWELVQQRLKEQWGERHIATNRQSPCWLVGLLQNDEEQPFKSDHTKRKGRLYYYYFTEQSGWRLPAKEIEKIVVMGLLNNLQDSVRALTLAGATEIVPERIAHVVETVKRLRAVLSEPHSAPRLRAALRRVRVSRHVVELEIDRKGLQALLELPELSADGESSDENESIQLPVQLKRRGIESRLILDNAPPQQKRDEHLVRLISKAHVWFEELKSGERASIEEIAAKDKVPASDVSRALPLAFLAPSIVRDILAGRQPVDLTAERLRRFAPLPTNWDRQRQVLGFPIAPIDTSASSLSPVA